MAPDHTRKELKRRIQSFIKARLERPFNLPTDLSTYPVFEDFYERYMFIMMSTLLALFESKNRELRWQLGLDETSGEEEEEELELGEIEEDPDIVDLVDDNSESGLSLHDIGDDQASSDEDVAESRYEGNQNFDNVRPLTTTQAQRSPSPGQSLPSRAQSSSSPAQSSPSPAQSSPSPAQSSSSPGQSSSSPAQSSPSPAQSSPSTAQSSPSPPPPLISGQTPGQIHWLNKFREVGIYGPHKARKTNRYGGRNILAERESLRQSHPADRLEIELENRKMQFKIINTRYPPLDLSSPSRSPLQRRRGDHSQGNSPESSPGSSPESSGGKWVGPQHNSRNKVRYHPWDHDREMRDGGEGDANELRWASVYEQIPPISGGDIAEPSVEGHKFDLGTTKHVILEQYSRARIARMKDYIDEIDLVYVGEQCSSQPRPVRGDLIIFPRSPTGRTAVYESQKSYLVSYPGDGDDQRQLRFTGTELMLRVGSYSVFGDHRLFPVDFEYLPYSGVELYASILTESSPPAMWKYLGHQMTLINPQISYPPYESPGKYLQVGDPVVGGAQFEQIVPRRGDVIIKREAWDPNFHHFVNFWYSMVKWHRGVPFPFKDGDMLVRRFIDNNYNSSLPDNNIPRDSRLWGWAELYEFHGFHGWIFWGRTKHLHDSPAEAPSEFMKKYVYDSGWDSERDEEHDRVNPRR